MQILSTKLQRSERHRRVIRYMHCLRKLHLGLANDAWSHHDIQHVAHKYLLNSQIYLIAATVHARYPVRGLYRPKPSFDVNSPGPAFLSVIYPTSGCKISAWCGNKACLASSRRCEPQRTMRRELFALLCQKLQEKPSRQIGRSRPALC